ncbi:MAG: hypothetical protein K9H16_08000 [Bacteroidales bacterium]|nr:hypothetical protein [Bacteroidales bacterium]
MKIKIYLSIAVALLLSMSLQAQNSQSGDFYFTSGGEMIFSFAAIDNAGSDNGNILRWSPVFNFQNLANFDVSNNFGFFSGINIRNVGFIYDDYTDPETGNTVKKKFRNYTAGIPVGLKIGNLDKLFLFGGYEIEFPFNYKEKTFENEVKTDKFNVWFSKRVPAIYHTFLVGIQFPHGANLKFKYYLTNFHNKDFTKTLSNGTTVKPYEFLNANVFYISLAFDLFKNTESYSKSGENKDKERVY